MTAPLAQNQADREEQLEERHRCTGRSCDTVDEDVVGRVEVAASTSVAGDQDARLVESL